MKTRTVGSVGNRVMVCVLDRDEEAVAALTAAVRADDLRAAQLTAVGGFRRARLGFFDPERRDYLPIEVDHQMEVLSLLGDVAVRDGQPVLHAHAVLGGSDGGTRGGHLLAGTVWPTLEVVLTEVAPDLAKRVDPETGLALIDLG